MLSEGNYPGYNPRPAYIWNAPKKEKVCVVCGKVYMPNGRTQKYCSDECRQAAKSKREGERRAAEGR